MYFLNADNITYQEIERAYSAGHNRRCMDGHITGSNKCIGYCMHDMHEGFLTEKLSRQHCCRQKNCNYFIRKEKVAYSEFQIQLEYCRSQIAR